VRLLIAHSSQAAREAIADAVQQGVAESFETVTTSEGSEALELLLQDDPPELALVDWDLPSIEGPEMCRLVRDFHHGRDTWLMILASSRHPDTADAYRAGARACISTPAPPSALCACVEEGLSKMSAPRARSADAVPFLDSAAQVDDDADLPHDATGPATLDAVCLSEGNSDFYGFGGSELCAIAESDRSPRVATVESPEPDEPRGAALLQAVLSER
jgi:two-component system chemotaxis response regulator CheY